MADEKLSKAVEANKKQKVGLQGFSDFIREQGIVGLSVGFILGGAVTSLSKSLVNDIVSPLLSAMFKGLENLEGAVWQIGDAQVTWGTFVVNLIDFVVIAAVVYFVVKGLRLDELDKKKK